MDKGLIIGVTGQARSGKDTFAEMLLEELFETTRRKFIMMAYANELKLRVQQDFDLSYAQLWGDDKEVEDKRYIKPDNTCWTAREIMQAYGQFFRTIDQLFWVNNLFKVIEDKEYKNVIITDVRHPNEADAVKRYDGYIIKVTSNRVNKQTIHGSEHISETAMNNYANIDFNVDNSGSLDDLRAIAKQVVEFLITSEKLKRLEVL